MHYVYKVTNNINGKFYIGKRKHDDPVKDSYMGSGKLILAAIDKYGKNNFTKEIIEIFQTNEEAAKLEKKLVTKEIVEDSMCYNMHEGGHGGFGHINNLPPEERINVIAYKEKVQNGEISVGGDNSKYYTEESYMKMKLGSERGIEVLKNRSEEEKNITRNKISLSLMGSKNPQYGTKSCVEENAENLSVTKRFKEIPEGWITTTEWRERRKDTTRGSYGRHWYNNGIDNYFLKETDQAVETLKRGRLLN